EVVVRRVLAAEDGPRLAHAVLDERVPHLGAHRDRTDRLDRLGDVARGDEVVDDIHGPRLAGRPHARHLALRDDRRDGARGDGGGDGGGGRGGADAAAGGAVEGEREVGAVLDGGGLGVAQVLRLGRGGRVVGGGAVELEVEGNDRGRQRRQPRPGAEHGGHG